ncbi:MAG: phage tail protein [Lachnospiraceae bacterium]|jgi:hypothetical protein
MLLSFDLFGNPQKPSLFLCDVIGKKINGIPNYDLKGDFVFNEISEMSFHTPHFYTDDNGEKRESKTYHLIEEFRKVYVEGIAMFEITSVEAHAEGDKEYKEVSLKTAENELTRKFVTLRINQGDDTSLDGVQLYNPENINKSLLHIVLEKVPHWKIGHIDDGLIAQKRSLEIDDKDIYSTLNEEIANSFKIIFIFDTINNLINIYDSETFGEETNVYISRENLAKEINIESDIEDIKTVIRPYGKDDLNIREVNTGMEYIMDLSYYATPAWMGKELYQKYLVYQELFHEQTPIYRNLLIECEEAYDEIDTLNAKMPDSDSSTVWEDYGLVMLKIRKMEYEEVLAAHASAGHGDPSHRYYYQYKETKDTIDAIAAEIAVKQTSVDTLNQEIAQLQTQMSDIATLLDIDTNFTEEERHYLSRFMSEDTYSDDCFLITEKYTYREIIEAKQALLDDAKKNLSDRCKPTLNFSLDMVNLLALKEFERTAAKFTLGNYIMVGYRDDYAVKVRLLSYNINFEDFSDFSARFGTALFAVTAEDRAASALEQVKSAAHSVNINKSYWQKSSDAITTWNQSIQDGLNTTLINITNGSRYEEVSQDHTGIHCRRRDKDTGTLLPKESWITSGGIYFSDDNLDSLKAVFGEFTYNSETHYGVIAEAVIAGYIEGSEMVGGSLRSMNYSSSSEEVDGYSDEGMFIDLTNGSIKSKNFCISNIGSAYFNGDIVATRLTCINGTIGPWKIGENDIYDASSGQSAGVGKNKISPAFWSGTTYSNRNQAPFRVTHDGKLTATNANISGTINASGGKIGVFVISDEDKSLICNSGSHTACLDGYRFSIYDSSYNGSGMTADGSVHASQKITLGNPSKYQVVSEFTAGQDGISWVGSNLNIKSWHGIGLGTNCMEDSPYGTENTIVFSCRSGDAYYRGTVEAAGWNTSSLAEIKENISEFDESIEEIIMGSKIYNYNLIKDPEKANHIGFVIGEGYALHPVILSENQKSIDMYSSISVLWKGEQTLFEREQELLNRIVALENIINHLKLKENES